MKPNYPKPLRPRQVEFLCEIHRAINDGCGTPREINAARPANRRDDGFDGILYGIRILMDRGALMPVEPLRPDSYLDITDYGRWLIGDGPKPKACYRGGIGHYIQANNPVEQTGYRAGV